MRKSGRANIVRLLGVLAILVLSAVQQPIGTSAGTIQDEPPCGGVPGCWACVGEDEEGNFCVVYYCNGQIDYWCF